MPLVRDTILTFMKANPSPICVSCLSRALHLAFDPVMDGWSDIRLRGDLPIQAGQCSVCGTQAGEVIGPRL